MENNRQFLRKELGYVVWFLIGFAFCYIFFVFFPQLTPRAGEISSTSEQSSSSADQFITTVEYTNSGFRPDSVTILKGNYIVIRNTSPDAQVWLSSDSPLLSTTRGYAESEQVRTVLNDAGTYEVTNSLNLSHKLSVIVR